jgi:hypothetical protein
MFRQSYRTLFLLVGAILVMSESASAAFQARFEQSGFAPLTITDNGAGDLDPRVGIILFVGPYGTFDLNTTVGLSKPLIGNGTTQAQFDVNSKNASSSTGGTLVLTVADTDFTYPLGNPLAVETHVGGTLNAGAGSSVTFQAWVNANNASPLPALPTVIPAGSASAGALGPFGPGPFNASASNSFTRGAGSYSIFSQATIVLNGAGDAGFDHFTSVTGEGGVQGRMTGGGSIFTITGAIPGPNIRITHGFELHCDASILPNNLQINVHNPARDMFHLENLISAICLDDPAIAPPPPAAPFDTYIGYGRGRWNGVSGYSIRFTLTDAGEPGRDDQAAYLIWLDGNSNGIVDGAEAPVLKSDPLIKLTFGNHQAHEENKTATTTLSVWQAHADTRTYKDYWPPTGLSTNTLVKSAFSRAGSAPYNKLGTDKLLQALGYTGGSNLLGAAQILLRNATASLLSASHPWVSYALTPQEIQSLVNAALQSQDVAGINNLANQLAVLDALKHWRIEAQ